MFRNMNPGAYLYVCKAGVRGGFTMSRARHTTDETNELMARIASLEFENSLLRGIIESARRRDGEADEPAADVCDYCPIRETCPRAGDPSSRAGRREPFDVL